MEAPAVGSENGPGITIASNNPFRNHTTIADGPSVGLSAVQSAPIRQSQNNPFLASFEQELKNKETPVGDSPKKPANTGDATELLKQLTLSEEDRDGKAAPRPMVSSSGSRRGPPPHDRNSQRPRPPRGPPKNEDIQYRRGPNGLKIPVRPPRQDRPRRSSSRDRDRERDRRSSRRNSESSLRDRPPPTPMTEEERKERDRRRKEREQRHREKDDGIRSSKSSSSRIRRRVHVDVVDQMDVTGGLYGAAGMFHHDGPFDACRPDRNRKKDNMAPMNAFPVNSANNTIGGSGPVNASINIDQFHGRGTEGYNDYGAGYREPDNPFPSMKAMQAMVVNPTSRVEPIHGEETMGLGTSTFLEGAPASRQAIQRTQSELSPFEGGLSRTKSLAVRLRAMSTSKRYNDENRPRPGPRSQDKGRFQERSEGVNLQDSPVLSPGLPTTKSRTPGGRNENSNPIDDVPSRTSYDDAFDKKGASIKAAELTREDEPSPLVELDTPPTSPPRAADLSSDNEGKAGESKSLGNSLLNRVKSLKGGPKRTKSERNPS